MNCNSYRYLVVKELFLAALPIAKSNCQCLSLARSRCTRGCGDSRPEKTNLCPVVPRSRPDIGKRQGFNKSSLFSCGDEGDRTPDLVVANHALSQLSYIPEKRCQDPFRLSASHVPLQRGETGPDTFFARLRVLGFEPRTSALSELRSSQLSYTRSQSGQQKSQTSKGLALSRP